MVMQPIKLYLKVSLNTQLLVMSQARKRISTFSQFWSTVDICAVIFTTLFEVDIILLVHVTHITIYDLKQPNLFI